MNGIANTCCKSFFIIRLLSQPIHFPWQPRIRNIDTYDKQILVIKHLCVSTMNYVCFLSKTILTHLFCIYYSVAYSSLDSFECLACCLSQQRYEKFEHTYNRSIYRQSNKLKQNEWQVILLLSLLNTKRNPRTNGTVYKLASKKVDIAFNFD